MNRILIAAIVIIIAASVGFYFWAESEKARFDASLPKPPVLKQEAQAAETETDDGHTEAGHWHGDEWHAEPHTETAAPAEQKDVRSQDTLSGDMSEKTPTAGQLPAYEYTDEEREWWAQIGLEPPPNGYAYRQDEDGNLVLQQSGVPRITIHTRIGFAPTEEQYERYLQLEAQLSDARAQGDTDEENRLADEMAALEAEAQGPVPYATGGSWFSGVVSPEEVHARTDKYITEALDKAFEELGLGHLRRR